MPIGAGVGVDTRDLRAFIAATRKASTVAAKGIRVQMAAAGEIVAVEARKLASEHSTSIAGTIRTTVRGATVSVQAGGPPRGASGKALAREMFTAGYGTSTANKRARSLGKQAANALPGLYELGNRSQAGSSIAGTFRHPVMGHKDRWVEQARYPFLRPAAEHKMPEVEAAVLKVADDMVNVLRTK